MKHDHDLDVKKWESKCSTNIVYLLKKKLMPVESSAPRIFKRLMLNLI